MDTRDRRITSIVDRTRRDRALAMMGPLLAYRDDAQLDVLLDALRAIGIEVVPHDASGRPAFRFRRGWGLVRGSCWSAERSRPMLYLGFGHPFNPLLWRPDRRLLGEIEREFVANGSSRPDLATKSR